MAVDRDYERDFDSTASGNFEAQVSEETTVTQPPSYGQQVELPAVASPVFETGSDSVFSDKDSLPRFSQVSELPEYEEKKS